MNVVAQTAQNFIRHRSFTISPIFIVPAIQTKRVQFFFSKISSNFFCFNNLDFQNGNYDGGASFSTPHDVRQNFSPGRMSNISSEDIEMAGNTFKKTLLKYKVDFSTNV